jgi:NAD+ synthase (glutamine-hydrolysing)
LFPYGLFRITAAAPVVSVANPAENAGASIQMIESTDADLILLPELGLTGYTCGDLFASDSLLAGAVKALKAIADHSIEHEAIVIVGLPLTVRGSLMNVAAVVSGGTQNFLANLPGVLRGSSLSPGIEAGSGYRDRQ